jgi:hypothetical protein
MAQAHDKASKAEVDRQQPPRIVIIGGGFPGIAAARALRRCNAEIVLTDRRNHHIFQPLLYQVATAILGPSAIAAPLRQLAEKQKNLSVTMAEVTRVDLTARSLDTISQSLEGRRSRSIIWCSPLGCDRAISVMTSLPNMPRSQDARGCRGNPGENPQRL